MERLKVFALFACIVFAAVPAMAQLATSTSLVGTVIDASGAAVPDANIVAVEVATGITYHVATNNTGEYTIPFVHIGTYKVTASKKGFEEGTHTDVLVENNQTARVDFTLQVGRETQTVVVTGGIPPIATDDATVRQNLDQAQTADLPLNGRNPLTLAVGTPGVLLGFKASAAADPGLDFIGPGTREVMNDLSLDGVSIMNNLVSKGQFPPSVDAIQEVQVQTGTYSAQYGGYMGTHINLVTKSGTNELHGDAFEFVRNDALDARPFFTAPTAPKIPLRRNQFGAELGGPVVIPKLYHGKNKTFFMVDYEGMRQLQATPSLNTVMDSLMRQGDFSEIKTPIHDPLLPGDPTFAGNVIPAADLSPAAVAFLPFIPQANLPGLTNNYDATIAANESFDQTVDRLDQTIGDRTHIYFRVGYESDFLFAGSANPVAVQPTPNHDSNFMIGYTQTIKSSMVNDFRIGRQVADVDATNYFGENPSLQAQAQQVSALVPGFTSSPSNPGLPGIGITGYLGTGSAAPAATNDETWESNDTFNYIHGSHSIMTGFDLDRFRILREAVNSALGSLSFTGSISGVAPADFLLGIPLSDTTGNAIIPGLYGQWRDGFFVLDKWNATRKLTLNVGLRYDLPTSLISINGNADILNATRTATLPANPPVPGFVLVNAAYKDFGPRLSFAYRITDKWVARGGFGIYYNPNHMNDWTLTNLNPPLSPSFTYQNSNLLAPVVTISDPTPSASKTAPSPSNFVTFATQNMPTSRMQQYSFDVERALWHNAGLDVQYLGNYSYHLDTTDYINTPLPGPGVIQTRRPYPQWGSIREILNEDVGHYNGMFIVFTQHESHGATLLVSYAYSHAIDMNSDANAGVVSDPYNLWYDYASANWDVRHRLVVSYVYPLPFFKSSTNALARGTLGGWQINGITTLQGGYPFTVVIGTDPANWGNPASERPNIIGVASDNCNHPALVACINPSAFEMPAQYTLGDAGRNILSGPGLVDFDFSLFKNVPIGERMSLQLRGEFFNFFNTPAFSNPNATFGTSSFGNITTTSNNNREVQIALKLIF